MVEIDAKKAYAIILHGREIEIINVFNNMDKAERLWKNPKYATKRDFATVTGVGLLKMLETRTLVSKE